MMPSLAWRAIWDNHPGKLTYPCDSTLFQNQCAIRMGVALAGAGVNLRQFGGARCYPNLKHAPKHILRAQELANWLAGQTTLVGKAVKSKNVTSENYARKTGIVFIKDGWGSTDHIDIWNGVGMKGGSLGYFSKAKELWFWALA